VDVEQVSNSPSSAPTAPGNYNITGWEAPMPANKPAAPAATPAPVLYKLGDGNCVYVKNSVLMDSQLCSSEALSATIEVLSSYELSTSNGQQFVVEGVLIKTVSASGTAVVREATRLRLVKNR